MLARSSRSDCWLAKPQFLRPTKFDDPFAAREGLPVMAYGIQRGTVASGHGTQAPRNWYPDPTRRNDLRYWDGHQWTSHVVTQHVQSVDPLYRRTWSMNSATAKSLPTAPATGFQSESGNGRRNRKVARQARKAVQSLMIVSSLIYFFDGEARRLKASEQSAAEV